MLSKDVDDPIMALDGPARDLTAGIRVVKVQLRLVAKSTSLGVKSDGGPVEPTAEKDLEFIVGDGEGRMHRETSEPGVGGLVVDPQRLGEVGMDDVGGVEVVDELLEVALEGAGLGRKVEVGDQALIHQGLEARLAIEFDADQTQMADERDHAAHSTDLRGRELDGVAVAFNGKVVAREHGGGEGQVTLLLEHADAKAAASDGPMDEVAVDVGETV